MSADKKELLRELDLLIIDEVSMVRADLLDAIDTVLRHIRRQPLIPLRWRTVIIYRRFVSNYLLWP